MKLARKLAIAAILLYGAAQAETVPIFATGQGTGVGESAITDKGTPTGSDQPGVGRVTKKVTNDREKAMAPAGNLLTPMNNGLSVTGPASSAKKETPTVYGQPVTFTATVVNKTAPASDMLVRGNHTESESITDRGTPTAGAPIANQGGTSAGANATTAATNAGASATTAATKNKEAPTVFGQPVVIIATEKASDTTGGAPLANQGATNSGVSATNAGVRATTAGVSATQGAISAGASQGAVSAGANATKAAIRATSAGASQGATQRTISVNASGGAVNAGAKATGASNANDPRDTPPTVVVHTGMTATSSGADATQAASKKGASSQGNAGGNTDKALATGASVGATAGAKIYEIPGNQSPDKAGIVTDSTGRPSDPSNAPAGSATVIYPPALSHGGIPTSAATPARISESNSPIPTDRKAGATSRDGNSRNFGRYATTDTLPLGVAGTAVTVTSTGMPIPFGAAGPAAPTPLMVNPNMGIPAAIAPSALNPAMSRPLMAPGGAMGPGAMSPGAMGGH